MRHSYVPHRDLSLIESILAIIGLLIFWMVSAFWIYMAISVEAETEPSASDSWTFLEDSERWELE